jgi:hypothetical protein
MVGRARAVAVSPTKKRRRKLEQIVRASSSPQGLVTSKELATCCTR